MVQNLVIAFVSLILGGFISLWISSACREKRQISFWISSRSLFSRRTLDAIDGFDVKFRGHDVAYVAQHTIYVWNSGNKALWDSNFATQTPFHFEFSNGSDVILDSILTSSSTVEFAPYVAENKLFPAIQTMDSEKGFAISVLQSVSDADAANLALRDGFRADSPTPRGHVIDLTRPFSKVQIPNLDEERGLLKFSLGCFGIIFGLFLIAGFAGLYTLEWPPGKGWVLPGLMVPFFLGAAFSQCGMGFLEARKHKIPKEFYEIDGEPLRQTDPLGEALLRLKFTKGI